ncbi:MAG: carboxymuconolactone decarboxylase family protein [Alphaproteobacteria bacterium]|nr:carboxymuconolactone decarboxylase family protein [Alphaproteobacteria bacterium]
MQQRLQYATVSPDGYKAWGAIRSYIGKCGLEESLVNLVYLRVSQINGCAYCVDLHTRDAEKAGESTRRLHNVVTWQETPFFTERERAALAWAESLTLLPETKAPDSAYEPLRKHFSDKQIADLTYAIALMNAMNRMGVGFRMGPPKDL